MPVGNQPDFYQVLAEWWGGDSPLGSFGALNVGVIVSEASNIIVGGNPAWGIADFLTIYPQFGTATLNVIQSYAIASVGLGYHVNDVLTIAGGTGGQITVNQVTLTEQFLLLHLRMRVRVIV